MAYNFYYILKDEKFMKHDQDTEAGLKGSITVHMANGQTLEDFCAEYIPGYNRDRFEALAIRVFTGNETVITIYAADKIRQDDSTLKEGRLAVKKFKLTDIPVSAVLSYCSSFNCTLSTGHYDIEDMEVMNK
jgi:hypothetical protein